MNADDPMPIFIIALSSRRLRPKRDIHCRLLLKSFVPQNQHASKLQSVILSTRQTMKLHAAVCALCPFVAIARQFPNVGPPDHAGPPDNAGPPDHVFDKVPDHVLDKFREKFGVKSGFELRKYLLLSSTFVFLSSFLLSTAL